MKLGYINVKGNTYDAYPLVEAASTQVANVEIARFTAPDILKIPASAKRLFSEQNCDAIVVFVTASEDDVQAVALVEEKSMDVEIYFGKFIFFAVTTGDKPEEEAARLVPAIVAEAIGGPAPEIPADTGIPGMPETQPPQEEALTEDDVHKLF